MCWGGGSGFRLRNFRNQDLSQDSNLSQTRDGAGRGGVGGLVSSIQKLGALLSNTCVVLS